jgi:hypothetical protein
VAVQLPQRPPWRQEPVLQSEFLVHEPHEPVARQALE